MHTHGQRLPPRLLSRRTREGRALAACLVCACGGLAWGQPADGATSDATIGARVNFVVEEPGEALPADTGAAPPDLVLDASPTGAVSLETVVDGGDPAEAAWLGLWSPPEVGPELRDAGASFELRPEGARPEALFQARTDRWATGLFSRDAELLTPLASGQELLSWDLTERLTLSSVGSRRVWDYRDCAFVVSAEAGLRLSPRAGLHVGYEVLQASTTEGFAPDVGGESLFARLQLRF